MHIVLISGSHRRQSQSSRVAHYLASRLPGVEAGITADLIDLAGNPLSLWDEPVRTAGSDLHEQWQPYAERLQKADGVVVVTPEWHGMVPAGLKNFFLYTTARELGHKPGLIVSVSGSRNGSYPVEELRISSYKNSRICYMPEHLIVRDAESMFKGDTPASKEDEYLRGRADFVLRSLIAYAKALKPVRESGVLFNKDFPNGM